MSELRQLQEEKAALALVLPRGENQFSASNKKDTVGRRKLKRREEEQAFPLCHQDQLHPLPIALICFHLHQLPATTTEVQSRPLKSLHRVPNKGLCGRSAPALRSRQPSRRNTQLQDQTLVVRKVGVVVRERPPQNFILKDSLQLFGAYSGESDGCEHREQIKPLV